MTRDRFITSSLGAISMAALLALSSNAQAQDAASAPMTPPATGSMSGSNTTLASGERNFVMKAALGGMEELALSQLAQQRGSDPQVKQFAERMASDHSKANDELMRIASARGVPVPSSPDRSGQREVDRLGKLSGAEFDRAYMKHMLDEHKKDVSDFEKISRSAKDADLKDFATRTLPTLQSHLQMAQTTYDAVRKSSKSSTTGKVAYPNNSVGAANTSSTNNTNSTGPR